MADDALREYLARNSPWLTLHDMKQEIQELRALVEGTRPAQVGAEPAGQGSGVLESGRSEVSKRLQELEKRADTLQVLGKLLDIRVIPPNILLADARRVERLNEDERIAGFLLALCTLFVGAWLQNIITSPGAIVIGLGAALCFGLFAFFYYWRSHKHWQQLHEEGQFSLWPSRGSDIGDNTD